MSNDEAVNRLLEKLNSFQETLSDDEAKAFAGMIEMAAENAEELSQEDLASVAAGRGVFKYNQREDNPTPKPQSSHNGLSSVNLRWLNKRARDKFQK